MNADELRALQKPLKDRYRQDPTSARETLTATGVLLPDRIACRIDRQPQTPQSVGPEAGLHPATGGSGEFACSGDMLLESLVACAGVTLCAVATAMSIPLRGGTIRAEGDLDFRGTLGVEKTVPVGFTDVRLLFELDTDADADQLATLLKLTERHCVVFQTLKQSPRIEASAITVSAE